MEDILRDLERELAETRDGVEEVNRQRKIMQENGRGEIVGLEESWKKGVGAVLDVEVAAEGLRAQALGRRREIALRGAGQ